MAKEYSVRPSALLGLESDPYTAWCLDEAAHMWGSYVDHEVDMAGHKKQKGEDALKNKRLSVLNRLLDADGTSISVSDPAINASSVTVPATKFKDPADLFANRKN